MIHNFWSSQYIARRFRENAGEYMKVVDQPEAGTSRTCPRCGSDWTFKRKRLFKCLNCGLGSPWERRRCTQHSGPPQWDGMKWETKRAVNTRPMKTLEAETESAEMIGDPTRFSGGRASRAELNSYRNLAHRLLQTATFEFVSQL